ncbi:MAG: YggT family protein [Proteobacteria bacterium SW_6_67_9]|nr:MAG: YggT family protein [Proteobacteria bacterium SW_6_67_9]
MGSDYGMDALRFLIGILVDLYTLVVILRFLLQAVNAHYFNPVAQFVVQATRPVLAPLRRVIPPLGRWDFAAVVVALALMALKMALFRLLGITDVVIGGYAVGIAHVWLGSLAWLAVVDLITLVINVWFFAVLILAILSWIAPSGSNPLAEVLERITDPLLRPVRRVMPLIGGIDLSPLAVLIGLQVLKMLLVRPLLALA